MDTSQMLFTSNVVENLLSFFTYPAHLKNSKTGQYICTNKANLDFFNLDSHKQLIGLTVNDLDGYMGQYWGSNFTCHVSSLEFNALMLKERVVGNKHIILLQNGKIIIQQMEKIPVIDNNRIISSILTISRQDLTNELSLYELYQLYKKYYSNKKDAICKFLQHIYLDKFFVQQPTESELKVLLTLKVYSAHKDIANVLGLAPKSVDAYISHLAEKAFNNNLSNVITAIRNLKIY